MTAGRWISSPGSESPTSMARSRSAARAAMVELARRLPRDRFAPEFVLLDRRGPLADLAEANGVPVRVLDWTPSGTPWLRLRKSATWPLCQDMRQGRYGASIDAWLFHAYALDEGSQP